ncbi:FAD-dependent monooxygenase-like protein 1 [Elsinoe fawcettii]|nr:FAD-dependent monooxygenase-like protein 1 [Elsinoe fawcettii]
MAEKSKEFRVLIIGAGIAGLTLANALEQAGVSYLLLEGRDNVAPQVGASIALNPDGARILDQLGCWDDISDGVTPFHYVVQHHANGDYVGPSHNGHRNDGPELTAKRTGYWTLFLERQRVLQVMYDRIQDKSKVLLNKRIKKIDQSENGVQITCEDGSSFQGDVVAGADGVNSITRHEMWRNADEQHPGFFSDQEKSSMSAEYSCLFGISNDVKDMQETGRLDITYENDYSTMYIPTRPGRAFWFVFKKLDRIYKHDEIPKYTKEDAKKFMEDAKFINLEKGGQVKLDDTFKACETCTLVPLEEAQYDKWFYRGMACLGDSIHKITPNAGAGGNNAVHSAAVLANALYGLHKELNGARPTESQVQAALQKYQDTRRDPVHMQAKGVNFITRVQASKTFLHRWFGVYLLAYAGDMGQDMQLDELLCASKLDFLPPPKRSLQGTAPYNPSQGKHKKEWLSGRLLLALPFFISFYLASRTITPDSIIPDLLDISGKGLYQHGSTKLKLLPSFTGLPGLDDQIRPATAAFLPSILGTDLLSRAQCLTFLTDLCVVYGILLVESGRRSNLLTIAMIPNVMALAGQLAGFGLVSSVFFGLFWVSSQMNNFKALDNRLTNMRHTTTVLPAVLLGFIIPSFLQYFHPSLAQRHWWNWLWQVYPITVGLLQYIFSKTLTKDTMRHDRIHAPLRDLRAITFTIGSLALISAATWVYTVSTSPFPLKDIFIPASLPASQTGFENIMRAWLQWDEIFSLANVGLWLLYSFWDLKAAGMVKEGWVLLLPLFGLATVAAGPGAASAMAWGYREYCLAYRKHKDAIITTWSQEKQNGKVNGVANGAAKSEKR